jgi:hypothetical protein
VAGATLAAQPGVAEASEGSGAEEAKVVLDGNVTVFLFIYFERR